MNFKTNKINLIARVMLFVLLVTSALTLTACPGWNGPVQRTLTFKSHNELLQFVEKYNSKNDGFVYTFVSFDLDDNDRIEVFEYNFKTMVKLKRSLFTQNITVVELYDKTHSRGIGCELIFYIEDIDAQIRCSYSTRSNYNFYQNNEMDVSFVDFYYIDDTWDSEIGKKYSSSSNYKEEFGDLRTFDYDILEYQMYYDYIYLYQIYINGIDEIKVKINSQNELSQEQLDEICQLLLDNIVIINTEG